MITLSGCSSPFVNQKKSNPTVLSEGPAPSQYKEPLTINDVTTALRAAGLQLNENQTINPADYQIDDINPVIYSLKQSDQILLFYDYKSIAQRKKTEWAGGYFSYPGSRDIPQKENWPEILFEIG